MLKRYKFYLLWITICLVALCGPILAVSPLVWLPDILRGRVKVVEFSEGHTRYQVVQEWSDDFYWTQFVVIDGSGNHFYLIDADGHKLYKFRAAIERSEFTGGIDVLYGDEIVARYDPDAKALQSKWLGGIPDLDPGKAEAQHR